jgi:adenylate cyclase
MLVFVLKKAELDLTTIVMALCLALAPILHRFGSVAAALIIVIILYAQAYRITMSFGMGNGAYLTFLTTPAASILLLGIERTYLSLALACLAAVFAFYLQHAVPYSTDLASDRLLSVNFAVNFAANLLILLIVVLYMARQNTRAEAAAKREYLRSESLLTQILPTTVAARLKDQNEAYIADSYPAASVVFIDMQGFTSLAGEVSPVALVRFLNDVYGRLDRLVEHHGLEKIKTTGDSYMVVAGVPDPSPDHAERSAMFALEVRDVLKTITDPRGRTVHARIGIASGPVVAGVVGSKKFFYDVWGDTVNVASRMESTGEVGTIQVAPSTGELLSQKFDLLPRGTIEIHGKGGMATSFLERIRNPKHYAGPDTVASS